ncbi:unnamed protein product (macronuclear) [Paramecium tetraurelia]|uniref:KRR1 small subunit processome component n=1 Tax=Paramecium tetraurelia TaxID=5888 RepID=A0E352_PARTE|nr:uncharacterized protein GSPATT00022892001 [Paramecium tetraurelia]CAK89719.1 unnamed protein product [Paramecium tetraurelia]|eukprot:XP_001457116.1 hypothetical protein (macronuclear) [Paramecium tetraurelia strain d4-2]
MSEQQEGVKNHKKYRKDKPWDNDPTIDKWKIPEIQPGEMNGSLLAESSFATLFPKYREKYIQEVFGMVKKSMKDHGIRAELNLMEGSLTVKTTNKTWDPWAIMKARDIIKLLARSVPVQQCLRLLEDGTFCDIIKIRSYTRNKEKFVKRRQRLIGPNGATLKALELLTDCYIMVQGSTVSVIGNWKNLKTVRKVVVDTMQNVHPIYSIKELMIKRELSKDENMQNENWDRFLPHFKKQNQKRKKVIKKKKEYTPFPPEQQPRKEDLLMASGEYFLNEKQRQQKKLEEKKKKQQLKKQQTMNQDGDQGDEQEYDQQQGEEQIQKSQPQDIEEIREQIQKSGKLKKVKLF